MKMRKFQKSASSAAVAVLAGLLSATANATVITAATNNPLAFSWSYNTANTNVGNLTGSGSMVIGGFNSNLLTLQVTLNNTSDPSERLTSFGFGINPNATGVAFSDLPDGGMINATLASIPSLAAIEVCAYGGENCSGGANGGIFGGASDTFSILLSGAWGSSVDIAPIGFKYQTGFGSFEFTTNGGGGTPPQQVPEPDVLFLLGAGLVGLALSRRRKAC